MRYKSLLQKIIRDIAIVDLGWKYKNSKGRWVYVGDNKNKIPKYADAVETRGKKTGTGKLNLILKGSIEDVKKGLGDRVIDSSNIVSIGPYSIPIVYDSTLGHEGEYYSKSKNNREHICIGDKFFKLPIESRYNVLAHEFGHKFESELDDKKELNRPDSPFLKEPKMGEIFGDPIFDRQNVNEAIAESFSVYMEDKKLLKSMYPRAYKYMRESLKRF